MYSSATITRNNLFSHPFNSPSSPDVDDLHQEVNLTQPSSFTSPTRRGAKSLVSALIRLLEAGTANSHGSGREPENLDILVLLPPEMSVMILHYLHPRDLCNASLVSRRWYQLTQCDALNKKRLAYIQLKRQEYQKSKLRYPLSPHNMNPQVSFSSFNAAPPDSSPQQYHSHPTSPTSPWESPPHRSHTSSPTFLVDDVRRLSLDDCPDATTHHHQRSLSAVVADHESRSLQNALYTLRHTMKEVAGRKSNKNRLRRLSLLS